MSPLPCLPLFLLLAFPTAASAVGTGISASPPIPTVASPAPDGVGGTPTAASSLTPTGRERSSAGPPSALSIDLLGGDPDGLDTGVGALVEASFDDYNRLKFDRAEAEARQAMACQPELPLPVIYLQAVLVAEVQELTLAHADAGAVVARFYRATRLALRLEDAWEAARHDAMGEEYLGTSLGELGLVHLYCGHLLAAYHDGQRSYAALQLALRLDPDLLEADLGLGEYLYECGRMSGFLRFFLDLHGNVKEGISLLETCGVEGGRCALLSRLMLAEILSREVPDYPKALPYVQEAQARYPENWSYEKMALAEAGGLGLGNPAAQALIETASDLWQAGWRPPAYAHLRLGAARLALAREYLREGRRGDALRQLQALALSGGGQARDAARLVMKLTGLSPSALARLETELACLSPAEEQGLQSQYACLSPTATGMEVELSDLSPTAVARLEAELVGQSLSASAITAAEPSGLSLTAAAVPSAQAPRPGPTAAARP